VTRSPAGRSATFSAWPGFRLPPLHELAGWLQAADPEELDLDTIYWDAPDLRLVRAGVQLRHHTGDGPAEGRWTLVVPVPPPPSGGPVTDHHVLHADGLADHPVAELAAGASGLLRGEHAKPIAHLQTHRRRVQLHDAGGRLLAEVTDDEVSVMESGRVAARFREVAVEAMDGAPMTVIDLVAERLREAGAGDPEPTPPLVRALGPRALASADPPVPPLGPDPMAAVVVQAAIANGVQRMLAHDPIVRLDLGSVGVHQMRVSTRRLRSDLKTFETLVDATWAEELRAELKWLADVLGGVRDLDVLRQRLQKAASGFPTADRQAAARLVRRLGRERFGRLQALHQALESDRYFALLDRLVQAARDPRLSPVAEAPAGTVLPGLAAGPWKKLRRDARRLLEREDAVPDEELHALRIRAKRARYAAEAVTRAIPDAEPLAAAVAEVQGVLGDQHDAVVAEAWLRGAVRAGCSRHQAMVAGLLIAAEIREAQELREQWPVVWGACDRKKLRAWLEP